MGLGTQQNPQQMLPLSSLLDERQLFRQGQCPSGLLGAACLGQSVGSTRLQSERGRELPHPCRAGCRYPQALTPCPMISIPSRTPPTASFSGKQAGQQAEATSGSVSPTPIMDQGNTRAGRGEGCCHATASCSLMHLQGLQESPEKTVLGAAVEDQAVATLAAPRSRGTPGTKPVRPQASHP